MKSNRIMSHKYKGVEIHKYEKPIQGTGLGRRALRWYIIETKTIGPLSRKVKISFQTLYQAKSHIDYFESTLW